MGRNEFANPREAMILGILINGDKYGREIRREYEKRSAHPMPYGSLYVTLDRMEEQGFVRSRLGESGHERGGNRRKYYEITASGYRAFEAFEAMAAGLRGRTANA